MSLEEKKVAYWSEHSGRWKASGLSQRQYCERESLALSTFDRWRRLLGKATGTEPTTKKTVTQEKLTLVPATVNNASSGIMLRSPAGWQVTLPEALGQEWFAQLLLRLP